MRDKLAEQLLKKVMGWKSEVDAMERPLLQAMANYKYDEYQQFSPGMRFIESLACWLKQFDQKERELAFKFIKDRLIYISSAEMKHLVSISYPDIIRPILIKHVASQLNISSIYIERIANRQEFIDLQRQSLFLGLSDGAHTDVFRRANHYDHDLSHEQIVQNYDISPEKAKDMLEKLHNRLGRNNSQFKMLFLLDDFSGSGFSYIGNTSDVKEEYKGKLPRISKRINDSLNGLVNPEELQVYIVLYVSTQRAKENIEEHLKIMQLKDWKVVIVQMLPDSIVLNEHSDFYTVLDNHYDPSIEDEHSRKGGTDLKLGFAACGLPLVLSHNTPNNSIYLLWIDSPKAPLLKALFPRVSRH